MLRAGIALALTFASFAHAEPTQLERAFGRMYNFDFPGAQTILNSYIVQRSSEPLPYALRASSYLFEELDRLGILEGEFFADDKRIIDKKKLKPDPIIRQFFLQAIGEAQKRGDALLAANPNDKDALFAMCMTQGLATDYMALVERRQIASLATARASNGYAQRLLQADPHFYDAYLTTGLTEYLVGSLPFFIRWFVRFDNVEGNKNKGMDTVAVVAKRGHFLKPFAKILLSIAYLRDKKPRQSRDMLFELTREYPENPLFRKELAKLDARLGAAAN